MNDDTKTLKNFFLIHLIVGLISSALALCVLSQEALWNFIMGELLISISLLSVGLGIYLGIFKKNIALLVGVIVFKWPILIYVVFKLVGNNQAYLGFFAAGFSIWVVSALVWAFSNPKDR